MCSASSIHLFMRLGSISYTVVPSPLDAQYTGMHYNTILSVICLHRSPVFIHTFLQCSSGSTHIHFFVLAAGHFIDNTFPLLYGGGFLHLHLYMSELASGVANNLDSEGEAGLMDLVCDALDVL